MEKLNRISLLMILSLVFAEATQGGTDAQKGPPTILGEVLVHCCYVYVCFVQVTTCGAPDALKRLSEGTFLLLSHLFGSQNKYQKESVRTKARQCVGSAKQVSKLSLGQNKHGQNITTPRSCNLSRYSET